MTPRRMNQNPESSFTDFVIANPSQWLFQPQKRDSHEMEIIRAWIAQAFFGNMVKIG